MSSEAQFFNLSREIGSDIELNQGPGGNTSFKENGVMRIKPSGLRLTEASIDKYATITEESLEGLQESSCGLKPSIETPLHCVISTKYVFHFHSIDAISWTLEPQKRDLLETTMGALDWAYIEYFKPGWPLANAIAKIKPVNVYLLENHGVVIASDDIGQVRKLILEVSETLRRHKPVQRIDSRKLISLNALCAMGMRRSKYWQIDALAFHREIVEVVKQYPILFPDQAVFLPEAPIVCSIESLVSDKPINVSRSSWIVVKDHGVLLASNMSNAAEENLYALAQLLLLIEDFGDLRSLDTKSVEELRNWDAEKYRLDKLGS